MEIKMWKVGAAALLSCLVMFGSISAVAVASPPTLRLFSDHPSVTAAQDALRAGVVDLGVWVTPVGGAFQIDVTRPNYGAWTANQVDPVSGATLRSIPAQLVDATRGLKGFLSIRFMGRGGHVVAHRQVDFCPGGESARVDDSGPQQQTYPVACNMGFFPFVRGIVWGIDPGWAVEPSLSRFPGFGIGPFGPGPPVSLPPRLLQQLGHGGINLRPGRYTAVVSITPAYQRLFGIAPGDASVRLKVRVTPSPKVRSVGPRPVAVSRPGTSAGRFTGNFFGPAADASAAASTPAPAPGTMPNLVALPAWQIVARHQGRQDLLTFAATIWNAGPAPFSIQGFRRPHSNLMDAYEYFFDSSGNVVGRAPAGTMFYDNQRGHHHWHLRQLAAYSLVGGHGLVIRSHKQSFCIAPSDAVDLTVPGADRTAQAFQGLGFGGSVCDLYSPGAIWLSEQLPAGWGDTYMQSVAGQAFDITHVPNGRYRIEVRVNPLGQLTETTTSDDLAVRVIRLAGRPGRRLVTVAPWHGIRG